MHCSTKSKPQQNRGTSFRIYQNKFQRATTNFWNGKSKFEKFTDVVIIGGDGTVNQVTGRATRMSGKIWHYTARQWQRACLYSGHP
jgi:hypothetical protein